MTKHFLLRLLLLVPAVWLIFTMVFFLVHIVPGDPVEQMLGPDAQASDVQQIRHSLGLDLPLAVQYGRYFRGVFIGDWGR